MLAKAIETIKPEDIDAHTPPLDAIAVVATILLAMASAVLIYRAAISANHWGLDIRLMWPLCATAAVFAGISLMWLPVSKRPAVALLIMAVTTGALVYILDHFNLLVEYDLWLHRGMP